MATQRVPTFRSSNSTPIETTSVKFVLEGVAKPETVDVPSQYSVFQLKQEAQRCFRNELAYEPLGAFALLVEDGKLLSPRDDWAQYSKPDTNGTKTVTIIVQLLYGGAWSDQVKGGSSKSSCQKARLLTMALPSNCSKVIFADTNMFLYKPNRDRLVSEVAASDGVYVVLTPTVRYELDHQDSLHWLDKLRGRFITDSFLEYRAEDVRFLPQDRTLLMIRILYEALLAGTKTTWRNVMYDLPLDFERLRGEHRQLYDSIRSDFQIFLEALVLLRNFDTPSVSFQFLSNDGAFVDLVRSVAAKDAIVELGLCLKAHYEALEVEIPRRKLIPPQHHSIIQESFGMIGMGAHPKFDQSRPVQNLPDASPVSIGEEDSGS